MLVPVCDGGKWEGEFLEFTSQRYFVRMLYRYRVMKYSWALIKELIEIIFTSIMKRNSC